MAELIRLINVAQVIVMPLGEDPVATMDLRPTMVEITVEALKTTLVMFRMFDTDVPICEPPNPKIVGRLVFVGPSRVVPASEESQADGVTWAVHTGQFVAYIRPTRGEQVYRDPSFGLDEATEELRDLYSQLRMNRWSLAGHQRLLNSTPATAHAAILAHQKNIDVVQAAIRRLEVMIAVATSPNRHKRKVART